MFSMLETKVKLLLDNKDHKNDRIYDWKNVCRLISHKEKVRWHKILG